MDGAGDLGGLYSGGGHSDRGTGFCRERRWTQGVIVVFVEGTPLDVQKAVVALSLSTIVHVLSLSDSIAVELPPLNREQALAILRGNPAVEEVIEDELTVIDGTTCVDPTSPPSQKLMVGDSRRATSQQSITSGN
jgi:hypothetical protein